jgi:hypothetical protein
MLRLRQPSAKLTGTAVVQPKRGWMRRRIVAKGTNHRSIEGGNEWARNTTRTESRQRIWRGSEKDLPVSSIREKDRQVPVEEDPVLSAEEEAGLPKQFKLRDPEEDVLDLPIRLGGNEVDVIITCEEDAIRCQHEVYWPGCTACEFSGPKGLQ